MVMLDRVLWSDLPDREEAGSPNVMGVVALHAAVSRLQAIGMVAVAEHEKELTDYAQARLASVAGVELLGPQSSDEKVGVFSFRVAGVPHMQVAAILGYEWGIGVRAGCFCAHPGMLHLLRVPEAEARRVARLIEAHDKRQVPGAVRASLGVYSTREDVGALVEGLEAIAAGRYQSAYELDTRTGDYMPSSWMPQFSDFFSATAPRVHAAASRAAIR
jgi:selenocysteine lyase/cysteine desulfurase